MDRVTLCLQLLLLVLIPNQSDGVTVQSGKLLGKTDRSELQNKKREKGLSIQLAFNESDLNDLTELNKQMQAKIDSVTEREKANNLTIQELLRKQIQLQSTVDVQTTIIEAYNATIIELREELNQPWATISALTLSEEEKRVIRQLRERQQQPQATQELQKKKKSLCGCSVKDCRDLIQAVKSGDVNTVRILANCNDDDCSTDYRPNYPPLTLAAAQNHLEVVRVLLEGGANIETTNTDQWTALHEAAERGYLDMARLLLDKGAKVDSLNKENATPLHYAALHGHLSVVQLLVKRGANVSLKDDKGKTASEWAQWWEQSDVVYWLDSVGRV